MRYNQNIGGEMSPRIEDVRKLIEEIRLAEANLAELRAKWDAMFGSEPPLTPSHGQIKTFILNVLQEFQGSIGMTKEDVHAHMPRVKLTTIGQYLSNMARDGEIRKLSSRRYGKLR